jgi:hypothetical protein
MKCATVGAVFLAVALIVLAACSEKPATAPAQKPGAAVLSTDAASIGTTVPTMVELSDMYVSPEIYDLKVTVAEIIRGEKSVELLKKLGAPNGQTHADSEYVLARVHFEYKARGAPGDKPWELNGVQFSAYSENSKPYANPLIVASQSGQKPSLRSGDALDCWLAFVVAKSDRKPVMTFNPGSAWFRLY